MSAVTGGPTFIMDGNQIAGLPVVTSACVPAGVLVICDWSRVVAASRGAVEIEVTGLASSTHFNSGATAVRCIASVDYAITQPAALVVASSVT
jgi:hypothetical protein